MATLVSVNVGLPKDVPWDGRTIRTGIWKQPTPGPRVVRRLNVDGDGQGDTAGHGGEMRAVLVYQVESYDYWQQYLRRDDLSPGAFGENFTVTGLPDSEVCIGDRYRIGTAEFEVTQPRVTCFRVGMRLGVPEMPSLLVARGRPGFYLRVVTEGTVEAGDEILKVVAGPHHMSVADIDALLYLPGRDPQALARALDIPALSPGWRGSFRDLLAGSEEKAADWQAGNLPAWRGFRPLRVRNVVSESASVQSFYLEDPDGADLPPAQPGQYLTVRVAVPGQPTAVRSYSLSARTCLDHYRISVKREAHGQVSGYLHDNLTPGTSIDVAAPRGEFYFDGHDDGPLLLISVGVGITPVLAMLEHLAAEDENREVWWLHGARHPAEHAFAAESQALLARLPRSRARLYFSAATESERAEAGALEGRLTGDAFAGVALPVDATAYMCGPEDFMGEMRAALAAAGLAAPNIRSELFGGRERLNPGVVGATTTAPHPPAGPAGVGPLVSFSRSGLTVPSDPGQYPTLLELAEACDVPTRWSCRSGVCHNCATTLLAGEVRYSPLPLEPPDEDTVLICCAQATGDVVLDL